MAIPKKKDPSDQIFDQEQQFILRMPQTAASMLANDIDNATNLKDKLNIELSYDYRQSTVRYSGQVYNGVMVDLPCIIESLKTTDGKSFYKTADISQLMLCSQGEDNIFTNLKKESKKEDSQEKKYLYNHGITRPLKNVRKRRFRKTMKRKYMDMPEIEKEVKLLLRKDLDAVDVKWSVELEQKEQDEPDNTIPNQSNQELKSETQKDSRNLMSIAAAEIFGDLSSDSNPASPTDAEQFYSNSLSGTGDNRMPDNVIESAVAEAGLDFEQMTSTSTAPYYQDESANMSFDDARSQFVRDDLELSLSDVEDVDENNLDDLVSKVQCLESTIANLKSSLSAAEEELNALDATSIDPNSSIRQQIQSNVEHLRRELQRHESSQEKLTLLLDQSMKL